MNVYHYLLAQQTKATRRVIQINVDGYTKFLSEQTPREHYEGQARSEVIDTFAEGLIANGWDWNDREDGRDVLVTAARPEIQIRIERVGKTSKRWFFEPRSPRFTTVRR